MELSEQELVEARHQMEELRSQGTVTGVRYDRRSARVVVDLSTGVQVAFPSGLVEGLAGATPDDLVEIEVSPAGLGLHWPRLDADVYVPTLLQGVFGSKRWMAAQLGAAGGKARSPAKVAASRQNGRKGGRPHKVA
jgi:hypothetical protein